MTWRDGRLLMVLDVGKSNSKIVLVDPLTGEERAVVQRPNRAVQGGPVRQLDIAGIGAWVFETLAGLPERARIGAIVPVAHGAACVMLDGHGTAVLAPDYEDPVFDLADPGYEAARDGFEATLSPRLPRGLNLGRQIRFIEQSMPGLFGRVAAIVPFAQYWSWLLSGVPASEVTSLGCHTDLWRPADGRWSGLVEASGWTSLFPPLRAASDVLSVIRPELGARLGLPGDCEIVCGIHDSNASFLRHRMHRARDERFSVVSSGTWTIVLSAGTPPGVLDPGRDMLGNVDAFGDLVGTARFMGGREYEAVVAEHEAGVPSRAGLERAFAAGAWVRPSLALGGQFIGRVGAVENAAGLDGEALASLATFYVALLTDVALELLKASGPVIVDGPLGRNPLYPGLLATLRPGAEVLLGDAVAGSVGGAECLVLGERARPLRRAAPSAGAEAIRSEAGRWRDGVR